jgi:hypothetical protein
MDLQKTVPIHKADVEKRLVYGVVSEPDTEDSQGDILSVDEIEKMAHGYLKDSRVIGEMHLTEADAEVVESYIAPIDYKVGEETIKKGSWVAVIRVNSDTLWEDVKTGDITGLSIGGTGTREPISGNQA